MSRYALCETCGVLVDVDGDAHEWRGIFYCETHCPRPTCRRAAMGLPVTDEQLNEIDEW